MASASINGTFGPVYNHAVRESKRESKVHLFSRLGILDEGGLGCGGHLPCQRGHEIAQVVNLVMLPHGNITFEFIDELHDFINELVHIFLVVCFQHVLKCPAGGIVWMMRIKPVNMVFGKFN